MTTTRTLAEFITSTSFDDIPDDVTRTAKRCLRDHIGVGLLGSTSPVGEKIRKFTEAEYPGPDSTIFGGGRAKPQGAAFANGSFAHVDDYDDTYESIVIHPSTPIVPAALAVGESEGADGAAILTAVVVGAETIYRVGHAVYPEHYHNGWQITATVGTFGAVAAASSLLNFSTEECLHALGIAGSHGPTSLKKNMGSTIKLTHPGQGAQRGVESAILVQYGLDANPAVLDGEKSYPAVMAPGRPGAPAVDVRALASTWALPDVGFKLYPAPIVTHSAIWALEELLDDPEVRPEAVTDVKVSIDESIDVLKGTAIATGFEGKFSLEFLLALVLEEGGVQPRHFTDSFVESDRIRSAMDRISIEYESSLFGDTYFGYGARLRLKTDDGSVFENEQRDPPGMPSNPASEARLHQKFTENASTVFDHDRVEALNTAIMTIESPGSLASAFEILS